MGFWSASLYGNDTTSDVKDTYRDYIQETADAVQAYEETMQEFQELIGDEEEPLLWYALADQQWKLGVLMPEVKEKALGWIERDGGVDLWEESLSGQKKFCQTLQALREKLTSPQPPAKKLKKPREFVHNPWNVGDIYCCYLHTEDAKRFGAYGKYMVLQKIGEEESTGFPSRTKLYPYSVCQVYDFIWDDPPTLEELNGIPIMPCDDAWGFFVYGDQSQPETEWHPWSLDSEFSMNMTLSIYKERDFCKKYFSYIGNDRTLIQPYKVAPEEIFAFNLDYHLLFLHKFWQTYEWKFENGRAYARNKREGITFHDVFDEIEKITRT